MSGQGGGQGYDNTIWIFVLIIAAILAFVYGSEYIAPYLLLPWKYLRIIELLGTFQFPTAWKVFQYDFKDFGKSFSVINEKVWFWYQFLAIPFIYKGWTMFQKYSGTWSMEHYLLSVWRRFQWLNEIFVVNESTIKFQKKFPFFVMTNPLDYHDRDWPVGLEPLDFYALHKDNLTSVLKSQIGPLIQWKNRQIEWQDPWAKKVAEQCYKKIPDGSNKPGEPQWRDSAWQRCAQTNRYERTFALGMLQEVRNFGVYAPPEFLYIRTASIEDLKKGDHRSFIMWRALNAFGGNTAFSEALGVMSHFLYEKSLNEYVKKHPEEKAFVYKMRADLYVTRAVDQMKNLNTIAQTTRKTG